MEGQNPLFRPRAFAPFRPPPSPSSRSSTSFPISMDANDLDSQFSQLMYHDDCVENSQPSSTRVLPLGSSFRTLMHEALMEPPPVHSMGASSPVIDSQCVLSTPPPSGHADRNILPRSVEPQRNPSRAASASTQQLPPPEQPAGRKRKSTEIWSPSQISVLLDLYEDKWVSINRGNFKAKHWTDITRDLNHRCGSDFSDNQCKYKWENLKKSFMKEKQKESSSGSEPSRWEYYSRMSDLLGGTPKVNGLNDGFTGEDFVAPEAVSLAEDEDVAVADGEGGAVPPLPEGADADIAVADSTPSNQAEANNDDGVPGPVVGKDVRGQKTKKRRTALAMEGLGASLERSAGSFAKELGASMERVEMRRMELEERRMQMEERRLETQLQIARIMARRRRSPTDSSEE